MIEKNLGTVVRELRKSRKLSLRTLSRSTGFSAAFMSQVENGQASPSISSMEKIAHALGVTLGDFFRATESQTTYVARARERSGLTSQWSRAQIEALGRVEVGQELEGMIVTLHPEGSSGKRPHSHTHDQLAFVVSGTLELTLGEDVYKMSRGDSATIRAGMPRLWKNVSRKPAQVVIVSAC